MEKIIKWAGASLFILTIMIFSLLHFYGPTIGAKLGMPIYLFSPSVERYGKIAIEIMDSNGYYANNEKWENQKEKALNEMKTLSSYEEVYPIIEESLKVAGGKHSFLKLKNDLQENKLKDKMPSVERLDDILIIDVSI